MQNISTRWTSRWHGGPHLSDESLVELHALLMTGEHAVAARYQRHVRQCPECAARLDTLRQELAGLRADLVSAAEALMTPARLDRQYDVIARRIDGQSGRILAFPTTMSRPPATTSLRRWVALAAACGLLVGVGAGRALGPAPPRPAPPWTAAAGGSQIPAGVHQEADEDLLVEVDAALARSRTREFRALDALTPRVADAQARPSR